MSLITRHSGQLYERTIPGIFLQYGDPTCIAVSEATTFAAKEDIASFSSLEPSFTTASVATMVLEGVDQFPSDENICSLALYNFSKKVSRTKEVIAITFEVEGQVIRIWTFIEKRNKLVRRAIYSLELELMDAFPSLVFDFNVVSVEGLKPQYFVPADLQGYLVFYRNYSSG